MPATKDKAAEAAEPTATEQAQAAADAAADQPEPEVRPDEFSAGTAQPIDRSLFPQAIVDALKAPLSPDRVRRRKGRGRGQFEYLAGHDVKRRANEIFGFGNWGHFVVKQDEIGTVTVANDDDREGVHVGYRCVVRVWVRGWDSDGVEHSYETEGSGYGDGVEYGPAARVTACELAIKESETDALKRAFTDLGDQFGLILYAKEDEKRRIESDRGADEARPVAVQQEAGRGRPRLTGWAALLDTFVQVLGGTPEDEAAAKWWLNEQITSKWGAVLADLNQADKDAAWALCAATVLAIESEHGGLDFDPDVRKKVAAAFAARNGGIKLDGPPWRLGPGDTEEGRPSRADWEAARDALAAEGGQEELADDAIEQAEAAMDDEARAAAEAAG